MERKLRRAMQREAIEWLPMYPEDRPCRWPTVRRLIDLFESVHRHVLTQGKRPPQPTVTELSHLQRKLLRLLTLPAINYGR